LGVDEGGDVYEYQRIQSMALRCFSVGNNLGYDGKLYRWDVAVPDSSQTLIKQIKRESNFIDSLFLFCLLLVPR